MLSKTQMVSAEKNLSDFLLKHFGETISSASNTQLYIALASVCKDFMYDAQAKIKNEKNIKKKVVHYMSIEFLLGRNLRNNLWNCDLDNFYRDLLASNGKNLDEVYLFEKEDRKSVV